MPAEQIGARVAAIYELQSAWLEPRLREIGVNWTTFQLLTTVFTAGKKASQVEVARRLGVTAATLSESVYAHVQKGLLEQVSSKHDRRVKVLQLTEKSKALMRQIRKLVTESETVMTNGMTDDDAEKLSAGLDQVLTNLESAIETLPS